MSSAGTVARPLRTTLEMIRVTHTVFALPFAILAAVLAAGGWPDLATIGKIVLAMIGARSAAMAQNRLVDREIDGANPRTASRALPAGTLSVGYVRAFLIVSVVVFLLAAASLNRLTLLLAPVTLAVLFLYSYTKRVTALCHLVLGLCLAMAPVGAWIAVRGDIRAPAVYLGLAVLFWTAGFSGGGVLMDLGVQMLDHDLAQIGIGGLKLIDVVAVDSSSNESPRASISYVRASSSEKRSGLSSVPANLPAPRSLASSATGSSQVHASTTSITSGLASRRCISPRLMRLISLSSLKVLKVASTQRNQSNSSPSTSPVQSSRTSTTIGRPMMCSTRRAPGGASTATLTHAPPSRSPPEAIVRMHRSSRWRPRPC